MIQVIYYIVWINYLQNALQNSETGNYIVKKVKLKITEYIVINLKMSKICLTLQVAKHKGLLA